jgi:LmbE family N-acetylglucosaminyl deacetylase
MSNRILSLHAHPDDAEIFAGGTLALLSAAGHHITIVTMTAGDCGTVEYSAEEISAIRRGEAARAAALIGAAYECLGFGDLSIFVDDPSRRRVTSALRRHRPDIVLTSAPVDYMCDHDATSALVRDACFAAPAPNYDTSAHGGGEALPAIPHLYYMDPEESSDRDGNRIRPHFIVDISSTFETKRRMLATHDSQRAWLLKHHGMDNYLISMEQWSAARGAEAGAAYGEGFRQYKGHPYPTTPLLQQLLGANVRRQA